MPKNDDPINSLPEYEVRTMEDDINKLEGRPTDKRPVKLELPPPPVQPKKIETTKTLAVAPKVKEVLPPEELPIPSAKPEIKPEPIIEVKKPEIKKAPLPGTEEFITKAPEPLKPQIIPPAPKPQIIPPAIPAKPRKIITPKVKKARTKKILIILIIVLAIIALGVFFYWQGTRPEPLPLPEPPTNEINVPASLIPVDETKILKIENNISFKNLLRDEAGLEQLSGTMKRIIPVKNETEILSLSDLVKELGIAIYPYVFSELKNNYTLILYGQDKEKIIGLIVETNNPDKIKEQSRYWEATMVEDLKNLFLLKKPGNPTTAFFRDNTHKNVLLRYINFPNPDLTIDYAVLDNLFILSISKEAMYNIIDRLRP